MLQLKKVPLCICVIAGVIHKLCYGLFDFFLCSRSPYRWIVINIYVPLLPAHLRPKYQLPDLRFNALFLKYVIYLLFLLVLTT